MNFLEKIIQSSKKTGTILERIGLYIEQKNNISGSFNYWDSTINDAIASAHERLFYKCWLWLSYIEFERLMAAPPKELAGVFGNFEISTYNHHLKEEMTEKLLSWAKVNLELV